MFIPFLVGKDLGPPFPPKKPSIQKKFLLDKGVVPLSPSGGRDTILDFSLLRTKNAVATFPLFFLIDDLKQRSSLETPISSSPFFRAQKMVSLELSFGGWGKLPPHPEESVRDPPSPS